MWGVTPSAIASRFASVAHTYMADGPAERSDRARRNLLRAIVRHQPATLKQVAGELGRGAPAVSRSVDALVRSGLVERTADPDNRRRLALRVTDAGRAMIDGPPSSGDALAVRLERLAPSELRAVERALEILERGA